MFSAHPSTSSLNPPRLCTFPTKKKHKSPRCFFLEHLRSVSNFESLTGLQGTSGQAIHDPNFQDFRHPITGCEDSATFHKSHEGRHFAGRTTRQSMESLRGDLRGGLSWVSGYGFNKTEDKAATQTWSFFSGISSSLKSFSNQYTTGIQTEKNKKK